MKAVPEDCQLDPRAGQARNREGSRLLRIGGLDSGPPPRAAFNRWMSAIEAKATNDPDRVVAEIKRRLKLSTA